MPDCDDYALPLQRVLRLWPLYKVLRRATKGHQGEASSSPRQGGCLRRPPWFRRGWWRSVEPRQETKSTVDRQVYQWTLARCQVSRCKLYQKYMLKVSYSCHLTKNKCQTIIKLSSGWNVSSIIRKTARRKAVDSSAIFVDRYLAAVKVFPNFF